MKHSPGRSATWQELQTHPVCFILLAFQTLQYLLGNHLLLEAAVFTILCSFMSPDNLSCGACSGALGVGWFLLLVSSAVAVDGGWSGARRLHLSRLLGCNFLYTLQTLNNALFISQSPTFYIHFTGFQNRKQYDRY